LQGLYAFELSENSVQKVCKDLADFFVLDPAVFEFSEQLIEKNAEYREEIDRLFASIPTIGNLNALLSSTA
jgi:hypothetical protein